MIKIISKLALCLVALSLMHCAGRHRVPVGEIPAPSFAAPASKAENKQIVDSFVRENGLKEFRNGTGYGQTKRVAQRLAQAAGYPRDYFDVRVVDAGEEVNAMVINGTSIVVYEKLIERVKNDDELAVVMGHELAHSLAKHHEDTGEKDRAEAVSIGSSILGTVASVAASAAGYGGLSDTAGSVAETTTGLIGYGAFVGSYSRDQEYEADHVGLMLMAKAGYDPQAALTLWGRSEEIFGVSDSTSVGAFFSTHPADHDRLEELKKAMPLALEYRKGKVPQIAKS